MNTGAFSPRTVSYRSFHRHRFLLTGRALLAIALCTFYSLQRWHAAAASEMLANGDFGGGNSGFGADLAYDDTPPLAFNGSYTITTNPGPWLEGWVSMSDHTTGSGQMLLATPNPGTGRIWYQAVNLVAGSAYQFSGWAARVSPGLMPILSVNVGSSSLGTFDTLPVGTWAQFSFNYTALTNGPAVFSITDLANSTIGNDFVLDDLSLVEVPAAPSILRQPQNQLGYWGKSVTFTVTAVGSAQLTYQWRHDGVPLDGATSSSLALTNLQLQDAGYYSIIVSNDLGSTTSSNALLTMNPAGVSLALYSGITVDGVVGLTYGIQYSTNLNNANSWRGLANLTLSSPTMLWFDLQPANTTRRYYRVVPGPVSIP